MTKTYLLLFVFSLFLLTSCQKEKDPIITYDIEQEFKLSIFQGLVGSNSVAFKVTTLEKMPDNYSIDAAVTLVDGQIELNIYRVLTPSAASANKDFISTDVVVSGIELGDYPCSVVLRNSIKNDGTLSVGVDNIQLNLTTHNGISASNFEVNTFPVDAFWGIISVDSSFHQVLLNQFVNFTYNYAVPVDNPAKGSYGYFTIQEDGSVSVPIELGTYSKTFYMTTSDFEQINTEIQEYKDLHVGFRAKVYTAQGQVFDNTGKFDNFFRTSTVSP